MQPSRTTLPYGVSVIIVARDPPLKVSNKKTNLAIFPAKHKKQFRAGNTTNLVFFAEKSPNTCSGRFPAGLQQGLQLVSSCAIIDRPHSIQARCLSQTDVGMEYDRKVIQPLLYLFIFTVKLGDKERFGKEQIGVTEQFPVTNLQ